jgi:type VII secretion-associated serine protease mycosin
VRVTRLTHQRRSAVPRLGRAALVAVTAALALSAAPLPMPPVHATFAAPAPAPAPGGGRAGAAGLATLPVPTDSVRDEQWQLSELRARNAWRYSTGAGVVVAVIDSGVDASHEDLAGQVLPGKDLVKPEGGDGHTDPVGHGTTVAGLIAGRSDDDDGVLGLAPNAKILPVRVLDADNRYNDAMIVARAVRWAVDSGAKVINLSLGGAGTSPALAAALDYAFARDVVVVACTGNVLPQATTGVWYPAREPGVIAVAGLEKETDVLWNGSITGGATVLTAPATDLVGAKTGGFWRVRGTSFAAPLVSAAAALVRSRWPTMPAGDVVNRLINTADDLGTPGRDDTYGFGKVDPVAALTSQLPAVTRNPLDDDKSPGVAGFGPAPGRGTDSVTGGGALEKPAASGPPGSSGSAAQRSASPARQANPVAWRIATAVAMLVLAAAVVFLVLFSRHPAMVLLARRFRRASRPPTLHPRRRQ